MKLNKLEYFLAYSTWYKGDYIEFIQYGYDKPDEELIECLSDELRIELLDIYNKNGLDYKSKEIENFRVKLDEYLDYLRFEKMELSYTDMEKSYREYYIYFFNKKDKKYYRVEITDYDSLDEFDSWKQDNFKCIEVLKREEMKLVTTYEIKK